MDRPFFARQTEVIRAAFADGIGCATDAFARDDLTLVDRPRTAPWPYTAMVASFGTGMVVSVDPDLRQFVSGLEIEKPEVAAWPPFLSAIAAEASRPGREASAGPISLVFALSEPPRAPVTAKGLELRRADRDWMNAEQQSGRFPNAVGSPERGARAERNLFALALFDSDGEPLAVGGVFETLGLHEIGVDVVPAAQGQGLAPIVVTAAARAILEVGAAPMYACAATNTRSQRTALASGFLPVASDAFVSASGFLPATPDGSVN